MEGRIPLATFRAVDVYPSKSEILRKKSTIKKNITRGKFSSVEQYLDIQFHLLREDFLASVREGISKSRSGRRTTNVQVYENVKIVKYFEDEFGQKCAQIRHETFESILENSDSKKLMIGSLLIFTKDNFRSIRFLAKVIERDAEKIDKITIKLIGKANEELRESSHSKMAECCTFFEPYFQVMRALQKMCSDTFPMERYIIQADSSRKADAPKYLGINALSKIKEYRDLESNLTKLNSAQAEAFMAALTQEFVVIQGPPGTGKTFLGLKIAETLIKNHHVWYKNSPMLIISHKNHALDQFLEGLIPITDKIVRVGGQSKSDKLEKYKLSNLRKVTSVDNLSNLFSKMRIKSDVSILREALVVAMTTTAAARMKETLEKLKCPIVIVEEAAEVLEAHVVAALTQNCQHLILLGDHKQLKPGTADHIIGTEYGLGVSLFERMVTNGIQCYKLEVQHRMRPEISALLQLQIYPFLKDHESVQNRPLISGVAKTVFFINHQEPEENANITSKKNSHEAKFLLAFAKYLILNLHDSENITILATYSGQVTELRNELKKMPKYYGDNIKISTLDAFQGQEADIILLSLVRSKKIGFLNAENRISVALSRARNGLYVIGNMDLLRNSSLIWSALEKSLIKTGNIGPELVLRCQKHPKTTTKVKYSQDFDNVRDGGCYRECDFALSCGHKCRHQCHVFDENHELYQCKFPCGKSVTCKRKHRYVCEQKCYENCKCRIQMEKTFKCGHRLITDCSNEICSKPHININRLLPGHPYPNTKVLTASFS